MDTYPESGILVEAESFSDIGGWIVDSQFELEIGSAYLMAHGNGCPVDDAITAVSVNVAGEYNVWVRSKDWVPSHHPGRFTLTVNENKLDTEFGTNSKDWSWQNGGRLELPRGDIRLTLHDLTGFNGRCDAVFFSLNDVPPPNAANETSRAWRRRMCGLPIEPADAGRFDVVVVGGGVVGAAAALASVRLGQRVALIHNRPYLGGNASVETGLSPRGVRGPLVKELSKRNSDGDLVAIKLLQAEPNATTFLEHTVYNTICKNSTILAIDARDARSGRELRFSAPVYIDCSGKAILGILCGADTLFGQESRAQYGESLAPEKADNMHHGNTLFFRTRMAHSPSPFPDVPWATEIAKDYADLGGQLKRPGIENGPGPRAHPPGYTSDRVLPKHMTWPLTHFWEYGQWLDPYTQGENIRDYLLRAIYGTLSNVKANNPRGYDNLEFDWVAFVPATGEFRRYVGDYVLTETDIRTHKKFSDAIVQNGGHFCLHYPGDEKYNFRLKGWKWDERDGKNYYIPFRCLYSANINNLMMAGKHISVTHIAGSSTKFMGNGAQHAIATAAAAQLCNKYKTTPRGVCENNMEELKAIVKGITGTKHSSTPEELSHL